MKHVAMAVVTLVMAGGCSQPRVVQNAAAPAASTRAVVTPRPADAQRAAMDLRAHADAHRGVVVVTLGERANDDSGPSRAAESGRFCSRERLAELTRYLSAYASERAQMGEPLEWSCNGEQCEARGLMEYDPHRVLQFARASDGRMVVVGYYELDLILTNDAYQQQLRADAQRAFAAGMAEGCR